MNRVLDFNQAARKGRRSPAGLAHSLASGNQDRSLDSGVLPACLRTGAAWMVDGRVSDYMFARP